MSQSKVLHIGISSTHNLGDVAISKMILSLFAKNGVATEHMDFNFSVVVAQCFQLSRIGGANEGQESQKNKVRKILNNRLLRVLSRLGRTMFFLPIVFFVFLRKVKGCEKVFIGGGNILMGIEYGFPLQVLSYVVFSRLLNKPVTFLCVGVGPFTASGVKTILRFALSLSDKVVCRDSRSKVLIESELGSITDIEVLSDPVLIWPRIQKVQQKYDVLFTFMPLFSPDIFPDGDAGKAEKFKLCLIELAVDLIGQGKSVGVLVTDPGVDLVVSEEIIAEVWSRTGIKLQAEIPANPGEMAALVGSASLVFSTRMHGAIMALSQAVPALCICWQPKINGLYRDLNLTELLIQIDSSGCFSLSKAQKAITNAAENKKLFVEQISVARSNLERTYESLWKRLLI